MNLEELAEVTKLLCSKNLESIKIDVNTYYVLKKLDSTNIQKLKKYNPSTLKELINYIKKTTNGKNEKLEDYAALIENILDSDEKVFLKNINLLETIRKTYGLDNELWLKLPEGIFQEEQKEFYLKWFTFYCSTYEKYVSKSQVDKIYKKLKEFIEKLPTDTLTSLKNEDKIMAIATTIYDLSDELESYKVEEYFEALLNEKDPLKLDLFRLCAKGVYFASSRTNGYQTIDTILKRIKDIPTNIIPNRTLEERSALLHKEIYLSNLIISVKNDDTYNLVVLKTKAGVPENYSRLLNYFSKYEWNQARVEVYYSLLYDFCLRSGESKNLIELFDFLENSKIDTELKDKTLDFLMSQEELNDPYDYYRRLEMIDTIKFAKELDVIDAISFLETIPTSYEERSIVNKLIKNLLTNEKSYSKSKRNYAYTYITANALITKIKNPLTKPANLELELQNHLLYSKLSEQDENKSVEDLVHGLNILRVTVNKQETINEFLNYLKELNLPNFNPDIDNVIGIYAKDEESGIYYVNKRLKNVFDILKKNNYPIAKKTEFMSLITDSIISEALMGNTISLFNESYGYKEAFYESLKDAIFNYESDEATIKNRVIESFKEQKEMTVRDLNKIIVKVKKKPQK